MELIRTEDRSAPNKHGHSEHTCKAAAGLAGKGYAAKSAKLLVQARELALSVGQTSLAVVVVVFSGFCCCGS